MYNLKFSKIREVKTPEVGSTGSVGIDFFIPQDFEPQTMKVGDSVLIPSGIKVDVPLGSALIAFNKSGVALKRGLVAGAAVIDPGYQGEVHLHLIKVTGEETTLMPGDKIVQFIPMPIHTSNMNFEEVEVEHLYESVSERGTGGFGSTGSK